LYVFLLITQKNWFKKICIFFMPHIADIPFMGGKTELFIATTAVVVFFVGGIWMGANVEDFQVSNLNCLA
jgi:hypothetical protein